MANVFREVFRVLFFFISAFVWRIMLHLCEWYGNDLTFDFERVSLSSAMFCLINDDSFRQIFGAG